VGDVAVVGVDYLFKVFGCCDAVGVLDLGV
jgi:hypothetical protein